jgi:hypothetical protein
VSKKTGIARTKPHSISASGARFSPSTAMNRRMILSAAPLSISATPITEATAMVKPILPAALPNSDIAASTALREPTFAGLPQRGHQADEQSRQRTARRTRATAARRSRRR